MVPASFEVETLRGSALRSFNLHGDNIVECERAVSLIRRSIDLDARLAPDSSFQAPVYQGYSEALGDNVKMRLLPGHGRWGYDIPSALVAQGSTIRENADVVVSESLPNNEIVRFAVEFCGALPAGNNAWQRHGRAYSFGLANVPYIFFNEIGGQELNSDRTAKAPRFPNPAVPLSLVLFSKELGVAALPVFEPAPSATKSALVPFLDSFGDDEARRLIRDLLLGLDASDAVSGLVARAARLGQELAARSQRNDSYSPDEWARRLSAAPGVEFYLNHQIPWKLKEGAKVQISARSQAVFSWLKDAPLAALGSSGLRFAVMDAQTRKAFSDVLQRLYPEVHPGLPSWVSESPAPLVIVLVTGFKPRGDDSRPDRGLTLLARMLVGQDASLMSFVSGPARAEMYTVAQQDPHLAAQRNGLLQAVFAASDWALLDTVHRAEAVAVDCRPFSPVVGGGPVTLRQSFTVPPFSEHDIDSVMHLAATQPQRPEVFEGMCNPPGGDWSGIDLRLEPGCIARWTSLPRVSAAKRPDHVIQLQLSKGIVLLSVESKLKFSSLEPRVGQRLKDYLSAILDSKTSVRKSDGEFQWELSPTPLEAPPWPIFSAAIAKDSPQVNLDGVLEEFGLDFVFAVTPNTASTGTIRAAASSMHRRLLDEVVALLFADSDLKFEIRV